MSEGRSRKGTRRSASPKPTDLPKDRTAAERMRRYRLKKQDAGLVDMEITVPASWKPLLRMIAAAARIDPSARRSAQTTLADLAERLRPREASEVAPRPPTQAQIDRAKAIAAEQDVPLPQEALSDGAMLGQWIERMRAPGVRRQTRGRARPA